MTLLYKHILIQSNYHESLKTTSKITIYISCFPDKHSPSTIGSRLWCNGECARLECGDRVFEPRSGQTKDNKIGICCFFAKHTALRRKIKDWLARNQDNVGRHVYLWTVRVSVSQYYNNPTKRVGLIQSGRNYHLIEN